MSTTLQLPHWDMTTVYPGLDSPEFDHDLHRLFEDIETLGRLFEEHGIRRRDNLAVDDATIGAFDTITGQYMDLAARVMTVGAYIRSFTTTNSYDDLAQARQSELRQHLVALSKLDTRYTGWVGSLDVEALIERSRLARDHAFALRKAQQGATHLMSEIEEDLASELNPTGSAAWNRLYGQVTSQLLVAIELDGAERRLPMSTVRNMAFDPDREVRRRGYDAELAAWETVAVPIASALNSIKGEANVLAQHRRWGSALDIALFINNIDRETLDAMLDAARASFPDFRRYMRIKARALGLPALAWYDLYAPLGRTSTSWDFDHGADFMLAHFETFSPRLRGLAQKALDERWIDAEPRAGKVQGAFCMPLRGGESRVLTNYMATYDGVSTLAHELGHAYHNFNLADRTPLQRKTPMTLAETASIFCETIVEAAAIDRAEPEEQIALLEASTQGRCQVVVDITSRFLFERGVFEARQERELSVHELCERMLEAQRQTYGDGLDPAVLHPYMWAVKSHYYSADRPFYNFPYMFGLLFGLGLFARYRQEPESFAAGYDDFLSSTGLGDAAFLARRFGIDIRRAEFWRSSLDIIRADIDRLERLLGAVQTQG